MESQWLSALGMPNGQPQQQPAAPMGGFSAAMQPMPDMNQDFRPASTPQELETRKAGWMSVVEKLQSNPNLQRALMMAGGTMMQPLQPGQTATGNLAQAAIAGTSAFAMGEDADRKRQMAERKEQRETAESEARVQQAQAGTASTQANTRRTELLTETEVAGQEDKLALLRSQRKQAELALANATDEQEVAKWERIIRTQQARIKASIPDQVYQEAALAEINAILQKPAEARARIKAQEASAGASQASARNANANAESQELTNAAFAALPDEERKRLVSTKFGGSTASARLVQEQQVWEKIYDSLTPEERKGMSRAAYVEQRLSSTKQAEVFKSMKDYIDAMQAAGKDPDPDILEGMTSAIRARVGVKPKDEDPKAGAKPGAKPAAAKKPPYKKGQIVPWKGPDGVTRNWQLIGDENDWNNRANWQLVQEPKK